MRTEKQKTARTRNAVPTPKMTGTLVRGSTKFAWIPGGGCPAGVVLSISKGKLSRNFGSALLVVDMIITINLSCHEQDLLRNNRANVINISMTMKKTPPAEMYCNSKKA